MHAITVPVTDKFIYIAVFVVLRENTFLHYLLQGLIYHFSTKFSQAIGCEKWELLSIILGETAGVHAVSHMAAATAHYTEAEIMASECGVWHFVFHLMCGCVGLREL
jgi:hypothetical protein